MIQKNKKVRHLVINTLCSTVLGIIFSIISLLHTPLQEKFNTYILILLGYIAGNCILCLVELGKKDFDSTK